VPLHDTVPIERPTPPDTYPGIHEKQGQVGAVATGLAGLAVGAALGAGYRFAKKLGGEPEPPAPKDAAKDQEVSR
jgi:glycine/D-amino acid oxidase-like deaminating enzyme